MPLYPDILNENCADISDWVDADVGDAISEVSPAGQFRFATGPTPDIADAAGRTKIMSGMPDQFTIETKTYFDALGTTANADRAVLRYHNTTWSLIVSFCSDGLFIVTSAGRIEVGTNIVKCNASASWQRWRFQVDKTTESTATVEVFLAEDGGSWASMGTVDCDYEHSSADESLEYFQGGANTANMESHIEYIKVGTGLGEFYGSSTSDFFQLL